MSPKYYPTPAECVKEFYKQLGTKPSVDMSFKLIIEEYKEWLDSDTPEGELKELADLVYVIYGYALSRGWDLDEAFCRVHSNNLGRMTQPDGTIKRREDGKVIKNPLFKKVNLEDLV